MTADTEQVSPTVLNDDAIEVVSQPARKRRTPEIPAEMLDALREEIRKEFQAEHAIAVATRTAQFTPKGHETVLPDGTVVWEFWSESPFHNHLIKRPTGDGFIRFRNGYYQARNENDRDLILRSLPGKVWPKTWPDDQPRPRDQKTGFSPGSFEAWEAFQRYTTPRPHNSM